MRDLANDVHRTLTVAFTALAGVCVDGEIVEQGSVTGAFTGVPVAFFNPVHVWRSAGDLRADLGAVVAKGDQLGLPFQIVVPAGSEHERLVEEVATANGFEPTARLGPGMALPSLEDIPDLPAGLIVEEVIDPGAMATIADLTADAFELPHEVALMVSGPDVLARSDLHWLVLRREAGEPVATSMVVVSGDVAGIFNVGVLAPHRGSGLGAAITWEAVRVGRDAGARVAVLESSDMGEPVYRRMGFETVTQMRSFARELG